MENLREYLKQHGHTLNSFAKTIGISANYLSQIASHKRLPSLQTAVAISDATDGKFTPSYWVKNFPDQEQSDK